MRVLLDTNVLVAAFATRGLCADVLRLVLAEHELLLSATVIQELTRSLTEKIRLPEETVRDIVGFVRASGSLVDAPAKTAPVAIRDADDAVILGEALAGRAEVLVTGDGDLLEAGDVPSVRIPRSQGILAAPAPAWSVSQAVRPLPGPSPMCCAARST